MKNKLLFLIKSYLCLALLSFSLSTYAQCSSAYGGGPGSRKNGYPSADAACKRVANGSATFIRKLYLGNGIYRHQYQCSDYSGHKAYCNPPAGSSCDQDGFCDSPGKDNGNQGCDSAGNPINITNGNKWWYENDFESSHLKFERFYNSVSTGSGFTIGKNWVHSFSSKIVSVTTDNRWVSAYRPDGKVLNFALTASGWRPDPDVSDGLLELKNSSGNRIGWSYRSAINDNIELYDSLGKLTTIQDLSGLGQYLTYDNSNRLIRVYDDFGRAIEFNYDSQNRIVSLTGVDGSQLNFAYDANQNLATVTYPNNKTKIYHYENLTFKNALTGITDENGVRYSRYDYDSSGRAYSTEHANGVNKFEIDFGEDNTVSTVLDPLNTTRTFQMFKQFGINKVYGSTQPAGSGCVASAGLRTYDSKGNISSLTDFNGNKTTYIYDLTRNLETSRTEGLTTAGAATTATRTITTTWHATWRLPSVISEYNGASATGTPLKRTTIAYDSKGNIISYTEEDPVRSLSRTTTTTYTYSTVVPGLVLEKVVDGPRTDVSDNSKYTFYTHDAVCMPSTNGSVTINIGCRAQLQSITDAIGNTSQFTRYNHHGQLEQYIDPNGVMTEFAYDLRQRLTSVTTGTETTQFTYDNAGLLVQTKFPDNSELNYVYDNAHRLTEISNTTGDKVVYTLDAAGNQVQEEMYDSNGFIAMSITRVIDALNRVQQVTGE